MTDTNSLSHSKWNCKYHIVFSPKYRRQVIYQKIKADIGTILRKLCENKGVEIHAAEACPDHIHMLVSIPPNLSVAQFMGYLKGKSSLMIFDRHANLKYKYGNRHFWCRGYYVDMVGRNEKAIKEYVRNQLHEDIMCDQLSFKEIKADIGTILRKLCENKGVEIHAAEACPDHIHMLVSIPPNLSVAQFMGYLKGKSSLMIFDRHANLKYKYGNRHFWCRGYYVDTVGRNEKAIKEYVRNQLQEDIMCDQLSFKEYIDPFTGSKNPEA